MDGFDLIDATDISPNLSLSDLATPGHRRRRSSTFSIWSQPELTPLSSMPSSSSATNSSANSIGSVGVDADTSDKTTSERIPEDAAELSATDLVLALILPHPFWFLF